jgi:hypothetical protein
MYGYELTQKIRQENRWAINYYRRDALSLVA